MYSSKIKVKNIEMFLQDTPDFEAFEKNWELEQIITPPRIAAEALYQIYQAKSSDFFKIL